MANKGWNNTAIPLVNSFVSKQITPNEIEIEIYEDIIKRNSTYRFETVDYDKQLFRDYVDLVKR